jgi:hypothetical protein
MAALVGKIIGGVMAAGKSGGKQVGGNLPSFVYPNGEMNAVNPNAEAPKGFGQVLGGIGKQVGNGMLNTMADGNPLFGAMRDASQKRRMMELLQEGQGESNGFY